jgi:hypothetical protein
MRRATRYDPDLTEQAIRDPEVIRGILVNVPAIPRVLLPRIGPRAYARYTRRLQDA